MAVRAGERNPKIFENLGNFRESARRCRRGVGEVPGVAPGPPETSDTVQDLPTMHKNTVEGPGRPRGEPADKNPAGKKNENKLEKTRKNENKWNFPEKNIHIK